MILHCVLCGEEAEIRLNLTDGETLSCPACGEDFAVSDVEERLEEWHKALAWIKTFPKQD